MIDVVVTPAAPVAAEESRASYTDWGAIVAGTVVATAIFAVLTTFGSAIGLSITSPYAGAGASAKFLAIAVAIWTVWVTVSSLVAGGYIAGRLRHRLYDASEHESEVRDGAHGLLVWGLAALLGSYIVAAGLTSAAHHATGADSVISQSDHSRADADSLLRTERGTPPANDEAVHREVARTLAAGAYSGHIAADDRAYLSRLVAARSGASAADSERRVDAAVADVRAAAEKARKIGVLVAFLTAASLAISAAAAWWAAMQGGKHRNEGIDLSHLTRWR